MKDLKKTEIKQEWKGNPMGKVPTWIVAVGFILGLSVVVAVNADMYVYPAKGQNKEQQDKDEYECHNWAVEQTGVDPMKLAESASSTTESTVSTSGSTVSGAARGAALGAIGGAIAGDAGKGAAIGAAAGGLLGHRQARKQIDAQHEAEEQQKAQMSKALDQYDKAYATCLQGRGYTVSQ
jgi:hypothetical protein